MSTVLAVITIPQKTIKDFVYEVRVTAKMDYSVDFELYRQVSGLTYNLKNEVTDGPGFQKIMSGFIKWDGCSEIYFVDGPMPWDLEPEETVGQWHLCGQRVWDEIAALFPVMYRELVKHIAQYDGEIAN